MGLDAMIFILWMLSFKPAFSLSSFTFIKRFFSFSLLSAIGVVSSAYLSLLIFLLTILIACASSSPAFCRMHSTYKLDKQGDGIQLWHTPFPNWNQSIVLCLVLTIALWPLYRFLRRQVRWCGITISWKCGSFTMIHTVKGFSIVNEAKVDIFLEFSILLYDPVVLGNLVSSSSTFSESSLNIRKFSVHTLLKPSLENFEHYFASVWYDCNCAVVWTFFGIVFLWDWMKTDFFQSCGHCWAFQFLLAYSQHFHMSTFTAPSCKTEIAGIPLRSLALFIVMLPKSHLTSHSRMSGCRWVITPSWYSGSLRSFCTVLLCIIATSS